MPIEFSVIIPTRNRAGLLRQLFQCLDLSQCGHETIVVDDGSEDDTRKVAEEYLKGRPGLLVSQPNRGLAAARNAGAAQAAGRVLLFLDDDMRPRGRCLEQHLAHHQAEPRSILIGAVTTQTEGKPEEFALFRRYMEQKWDRALPREKGRLSTLDLYVAGANFSIPKVLLDELGGHDERCLLAQDFDLAARASLSNVPVFYDPAAVAYHDDGATFLSFARRLRQYHQGDARVLEMKPQYAQHFRRFQPKRFSSIRVALYGLLSWPWALRLLNRWGGLPEVLPPRLRLRLYEHLIFGLTHIFPARRLD